MTGTSTDEEVRLAFLRDAGIDVTKFSDDELRAALELPSEQQRRYIVDQRRNQPSWVLREGAKEAALYGVNPDGTASTSTGGSRNAAGTAWEVPVSSGFAATHGYATTGDELHEVLSPSTFGRLLADAGSLSTPVVGYASVMDLGRTTAADTLQLPRLVSAFAPAYSSSADWEARIVAREQSDSMAGMRTFAAYMTPDYDACLHVQAAGIVADRLDELRSLRQLALPGVPPSVVAIESLTLQASMGDVASIELQCNRATG